MTVRAAGLDLHSDMLRHIGRLRHASLTVPLSFSVLDDYRDTEESRSCEIDSFSDVVELEKFDVCNTIEAESEGCLEGGMASCKLTPWIAWRLGQG